jgi:WD40 repeat protein
LFRAIEGEEPRDPREHNPALPPEIAAVLAVALAKQPARRYASALEFAEDLRHIRVYEPIRARPPGPVTRLILWTQRNPLLAATILGLAVALGFSLYTLSSERAALRVALGRHLGSRANALVNEDPSAAVALGVQACELAPNYLTRAALLSALDGCALERELRVPQARTSEDFALDSQGRWIAVALGGFEDGSTRLVFHGLSGSSPSVELPGPHGAIQKLLWVEAQQILLSAEQDGHVRAFDPAQRRLIAQTQLGSGLRQWLVSRDGSTLLALARDGSLTALTLPDLSQARVLAAQGIDSARLSIVRDSVWVATAGGARFTELDLLAARELDIRQGPPEGVLSFEVTPDALMLATADNQLLKLDLGSGALEPVALGNNSLRIEELRLDPSSQRLLVLLARDERGAAFLLEPHTGQRTELLPEDSRFALRGAFRGDGARVALACSDMSVRIFDCASGAMLQLFRGRFRAQDLAYSADGSRLYTRNVGGALMCWYASTRPDLLRFRVPGAIERIGWNAARGRFEAFTQDGLRHELDLSSDAPLLSEPAPPRSRNEQLWELPGGVLRQLANHRVAFEPRGVAEGSGAAAGKSFELDLSKPAPCTVRDVAFAPDGSEFALVTNSLRVLRVRLPEGSVLEELRPFVARSAIYSPDSRHLLLLGEHGGGAFRMLQLEGGGKSRILPSEIIHTADLCLGGFSPDGTVFVTASRDGMVFVRETRGGLPRTQFQTAGLPTALGFEAEHGTNSARVLVGSAEGNVHGFPIDPLPALEGRLPRPLEAWEIGNEQRLALPLRYNPKSD